jgi:hypothetical protein
MEKRLRCADDCCKENDMNESIRIIKDISDTVASVHDQRDRLAQQVGLLQAKIRSLCQRYEGEGVKPAKGCDHSIVYAGDAPIRVEWEYEAGEPAVWSLDSPMCGPGSPAAVYIGSALVNGEWVNPEDVFAESLIERWRDELLEGRQQEERQAIEDYYAERARDGFTR